MSNTPRILFIGHAEMAARCLRILNTWAIERGGLVVGVLTAPRGSYGWWSEVYGGPEVWEAAEDLNLRLIAEDDLEVIDYNMIICFNYGKRLSFRIINKATLGSFNIHTAPLPSCRGVNCYTHAIIAGDTTFGVSLHKIDVTFDTGDIVTIDPVPILPNDTAISLAKRCADKAVEMFERMVNSVISGQVQSETQESLSKRLGVTARYYSKKDLQALIELGPDDALPAKIDVLIRALTFPPLYSPPAWMQRNDD